MEVKQSTSDMRGMVFFTAIFVIIFIIFNPYYLISISFLVRIRECESDFIPVILKKS